MTLEGGIAPYQPCECKARRASQQPLASQIDILVAAYMDRQERQDYSSSTPKRHIPVYAWEEEKAFLVIQIDLRSSHQCM
jgi:hypothetical protein